MKVLKIFFWACLTALDIFFIILVIFLLIDVLKAMNWQMIAGGVSICIALFALSMSIYSSYLTRKHNRISVKPFLTAWYDARNNNFFVDVINNGIGPALIKEAIVKVDGKVIGGRREELIEKAVNIVFIGCTFDADYALMGDTSAMASKEKITIVDVTFKGLKVPVLNKLNEFIARADLIIKYESMYGEKFTFSTEKLKAKGII